MKYKLVAFWLIVFGALFAFLQMCFEYHFYYIEQSQLFLFSEAYIRNKLLLPGGFSMLVAEFLVQFFIRPYVGALVTAALLTGVGVCTAGIVRGFLSLMCYRCWLCCSCISTSITGYRALFAT